MICQSCGGIIGRDCFNPQECMWITQDMQAQQHYERGRLEEQERQIGRIAEEEYGDHLWEEWERHMIEDVGFDPIYLGC